MKSVYLDPVAFQEQVDKYSSETEKVSSLQYSVDENGIMLQSIDKYIECIYAMNDLISEFSTLAALDADTMKRIKANWMNADSDIAIKTLGEILSGK